MPGRYDRAMHQNPKRRRWIRYSLRTLLAVVTILCIWLAWNVHRVRQREATLKYLMAGDPSGGPPIADIDTNWDVAPWKKLPWLWSLLGATPVPRIHLRKYDFSEDDRQEIASLFPEAIVVLWD